MIGSGAQSCPWQGQQGWGLQLHRLSCCRTGKTDKVYVIRQEAIMKNWQPGRPSDGYWIQTNTHIVKRLLCASACYLVNKHTGASADRWCSDEQDETMVRHKISLFFAPIAFDCESQKEHWSTALNLHVVFPFCWSSLSLPFHRLAIFDQLFLRVPLSVFLSLSHSSSCSPLST